MKFSQRIPLKKFIKEDLERDYINTFEYKDMSLIWTNVYEQGSNTKIYLNRQDIAEACIDFIEKKALTFKSKF